MPLASASWWHSGLDSGRPTPQGDVTPQRQCGLPVVRGEAAGEGMRWHLTEAWMEYHGMGVARISPTGSVARSQHRWAAVMGRHDAP
jgi:hypothetical protein